MAIAVSDSTLRTGNPLIDGLIQGGSWTTDGDPAHTAHELTYSINKIPNGTYAPQFPGAVAAALATWSDVADVTFTKVGIDFASQFNDSTADLAFSLMLGQLWHEGAIGLGIFPDTRNGDAASQELSALFGTTYDRTNYPNPEGDIFFETSWPGWGETQPGGAGLDVLIHEIGHALGLKHPFDDGGNGRPTFAQLGIGSKNTGFWTVMSYHVTSPLLTAGNQATPMPLDILAIQHIYGPNLSYHAGDDTYALADDGVVRTIWDAGGTDTIDASNLSRGLTLDLHEASFIRTGTHSVTALAYNVTENNVIVDAIENAVGTKFADRILGNTVDNSLNGGGGNDMISGDAGNDALDGGSGADRMTGGSGDDTYIVDNKADVAIETAADGGHDVVNSFVSFTLGPNIEDLVLQAGASAALIATGNTADNLLQGNEFNNMLDGKAGADTMVGGKGDDVYIVDNPSDSIIENPGEGTDEVRTYLGSLTAVANVENYTLTGKAAVDFSGNALDNKITGTAKNDTLDGGDGNDTLDGGAGADSLAGGTGNDTYVINSTMDKISETGGDAGDAVQAPFSVDLSLAAYAGIENVTLTGTAALKATGSAVANHLVGNSGANVLDGREGADTLEGGKGNDAYLVDNSGDIVVEIAGGGIDTVKSTTSYTLVDPFVENLTLLAGAGDISATGNALANTLTGNEGNNSLDGGLGADRMIGGLGDDTYIVTNAKDIVIEAAKAGTDTVQSSVSYTLGANVEDLLMVGAAAVGTGNALNNVITGDDAGDKLSGLGGNDTITGGAGNDTIDGGLGNDSLTGGAGSDTYVLNSTLDAVHEDTGGGSDTVVAPFSIDLTAPAYANIENVTLQGSAALFATGTDADNNRLIGNAGANTLIGNGGDDTLNGGAGADHLVGGAGNDIYVVDNIKDVVDESSGSGTDTVQSSISFSLVENGATVKGALENLTLIGAGGLTGAGNELANLIIGNSGANKLIGGGGSDTLDGGAGNDTLIGGLASDTFVRHSLAAEGKDTITDFQAGPGGDKLDIHDLLTGFNSGTSNPNDFVHLAESGGNTTVQIDANGAVDGATFTSVIVLTGVIGVDVDQLVNDGNLQLA